MVFPMKPEHVDLIVLTIVLLLRVLCNAWSVPVFHMDGFMLCDSVYSSCICFRSQVSLVCEPNYEASKPRQLLAW